MKTISKFFIFSAIFFLCCDEIICQTVKPPSLESLQDIAKILLTNDKAKKKLIDCLLDLSPCNEIGKIGKTVLPLLLFGCKDCNAQETSLYGDVRQYIQTNHPKFLIEVLRKYGLKSTDEKLPSEGVPMPLPSLEDIEDILEDKESAANVFKCILDQGPCNIEAETLKFWTSKSIFGCPECESAEKRNLAAFKQYLEKNFSREWYEIMKKLDPKSVPVSTDQEGIADSGDSSESAKSEESVKSVCSHFVPSLFVLGSILSRLL